MKHFVYKTTNIVNQKYYYGVHSTSNLDDGYIGSGKLLLAAIKKYGADNFKREIIKMCSTREEAFAYEREIVNQEMVNDPMCYNLMIGGKGQIRIYSDEERKERNKMYQKSYFEKHPEVAIKHCARWRDKNKEHLKEYRHQYNEDNKEHLNDVHREWAKNNIEKSRKSNRDCYERNKDKRHEYHQRPEVKERQNRLARERRARKKAEKLAQIHREMDGSSRN